MDTALLIKYIIYSDVLAIKLCTNTYKAYKNSIYISCILYYLHQTNLSFGIKLYQYELTFLKKLHKEHN